MELKVLLILVDGSSEPAHLSVIVRHKLHLLFTCQNNWLEQTKFLSIVHRDTEGGSILPFIFVGFHVKDTSFICKLDSSSWAILMCRHVSGVMCRVDACRRMCSFLAGAKRPAETPRRDGNLPQAASEALAIFRRPSLLNVLPTSRLRPLLLYAPPTPRLRLPSSSTSPPPPLPRQPREALRASPARPPAPKNRRFRKEGREGTEAPACRG
nr:uncharacterized protein LOC117845333 isoform X1 [Setaria viridis]